MKAWLLYFSIFEYDFVTVGDKGYLQTGRPKFRVMQVMRTQYSLS